MFGGLVGRLPEEFMAEKEDFGGVKFKLSLAGEVGEDLEFRPVFHSSVIPSFRPSVGASFGPSVIPSN